MITSFEVGAIFKIVNQASPTLSKILKQIQELQVALDRAKKSLDTLVGGGAVGSTSLAPAIDGARTLAKEWGSVANNAERAQLAIGNAAMSSTRGGASAAMRHRVIGQRAAARSGFGHASVYGPGMSIPGGGKVHFAGPGLGPAAALAGGAAYGAYEAAQMEDAVTQLNYYAGLEQNDANGARFRKILQDSMRTSGYGLHDISESAKKEMQMFQGTPGGGLNVLPEMLKAATTEARLKGSSPEEAMTALIGLAHMTKQYSPEEIKKLTPAFAFLSTANPSSLGSMERAAGYAVPMLQSGLGIDPMTTLLMGTALTRAGAVNTKSGTWLREMAMRSLPGTSLMSKAAFARHEEALKAFGLVDDHDNPTWFTNGKADLFKMMDIATAHANQIPLEKRASYEKALFGAQGGGAFALLSDQKVREQVLSLQSMMNSEKFKNQYGGYSQMYNANSTVQQSRTALGEFNIAMMDIGQHTLPAVKGALEDFRGALRSIEALIPGAKNGESVIGKRAIEGLAGGAAIGAAVGAVGGPFGMVAGGLAGGVLGTAAGYLEQQHNNNKDKWKAEDQEKDKAIANAVRGYPASPGGVFPGGTSVAPPPPQIHLNVNIDGKKVGDALSEVQVPYQGFPSQAPAADGVRQSYTGDHQLSSQ